MTTDVLLIMISFINVCYFSNTPAFVFVYCIGMFAKDRSEAFLIFDVRATPAQPDRPALQARVAPPQTPQTPLLEWQRGERWHNEVNFKCARCNVVRRRWDFSRAMQRYTVTERVCFACS